MLAVIATPGWGTERTGGGGGGGGGVGGRRGREREGGIHSIFIHAYVTELELQRS